MKRIFKGLLLCIFIVVLTSCGKVKCIEKEITLPKEIKNLSRVIYLGKDIYGIDVSNFSQDKGRTTDYKVIKIDGNLIFKDNIKNIYDDTNFWESGSILLEKDNNMFALIDEKGKELLTEHKVYDIGEGIYKVSYPNGENTYFNSLGNRIVENMPNIISFPKDPNYLEYRNKNGKYGVINNKGKIIIQPIFDNISVSHKNLRYILVCKNKRWGVMDKSGKELLPFKYDRIGECEYGGLLVTLNKEHSFIDDNLKNIYKLDKFIYMRKGIAIVLLKNSRDFKVIDEKGNILIDDFNIKNLNFIDDKNIVREINKDKVHGYQLLSINRDKRMEELKLKAIYDRIIFYKDDLFRIKKNNKYGFMNRQGKIIVPVKYSNELEFNDDFCIVNLGGKYGVLDKENNYKINPKYENIKYIPKGYFAVKLNNKWGIVDSHDKTVKPIEYDDISGIESKIKCDYNVLMKKGDKGLLLKLE